MRAFNPIPLVLAVALVAACQPQADNATRGAEAAEPGQEQPAMPFVTFRIGEGRAPVQVGEMSLDSEMAGYQRDPVWRDPPAEVLEAAMERDRERDWDPPVERLWQNIDGLWCGVASGLNEDLEEGRLIRLHIDAPAQSDLTYCIGLYSNMASSAALGTPETWECCAHVPICGVKPDCPPL